MITGPGDAYPVAKRFYVEGFTLLEKTLTIVGDDFVQCHASTVFIDFNQVALEAQVAPLELNDQGVMVLLQLTQDGNDLDGCLEHLGRLRTALVVERAGHRTELSGS